MKKPMELIQGTLDLLILNALSWGENHGYGISRSIRQRTDGLLLVQDAALYQGLRRMEKKRWVRAEWGSSETGRRARYYTLTDMGRRQLETESSNWRLYVAAVFKVLDPGAAEA